MSLESGRKLGLTASLIYVISPVIIVVAYVFLIFSLFAAFPFGTSPTSSFLSLPVFIILIGLSGIISFAGVILFIVAMHRLSQYYSEPGIFKNALYGFIINFVGVITGILVYVAVFLSTTLGSITPSGIQTTAVTPTPTPSTILASLGLFIVMFLALLAVFLVLGIVSGLFYMRAFNKLGEKSGVNSFNTAGLLILIGVIIPMVSWIGWIFAVSGFHSLKPKPAESSSAYYTTPTSSPTAAQNKYCPYCGTANNADAIYCKSCGRQL